MSTESHDRRREPRLRLRVGLAVSGHNAEGAAFRFDAVTFDVSPSGAAIELPMPLPVGSTVAVTGRKFAFEARGVVRHNYRHRSTANAIVGIEFLDGAHLPVVNWY